MLKKEYTDKFLLNLYKQMVMIRLCEERFVNPILNGDIRCPVHLCSGQEAVAVGACSALKKQDFIFGTHRSHGHYIAKGGSLRTLVSEVYGKETGCSKGRGGSMHLVDIDNGMLGSAPIVAGTISLAVGVALASKVQKKNRVGISFFGDGATGEGVLYEALNFAKIHKLPIIFLCENNLYSTHMPILRTRPNEDIFKIAEPFDIASMIVDGNDVIAVHESVKKSVDKCRAGDGPVFIECKTYRLKGHVGPDDNIQGIHTDIRPDEEVKKWLGNDPISVFESFLLKRKVFEKSSIQNMKSRILKRVENAFEYAQNSPCPDEKEVERYVYQ